MVSEDGEPFNVGAGVKKGGKFPQWAIWTIVGVAALVIVGIAVGVTLTLSGVGKSNRDPEITSLTAVPPVVAPGGYSTITCIASDPEGGTLDYDWATTGGSVSGIGNVVSWIAPNVAGTFSIVVSVSDESGGTTNDSITLATSAPTSTPTPTPTPTLTPTPVSTYTPAVSYGSLRINSSPSGAQIYIDDILDSNVTPCTLIHIGTGIHNVRLAYPGYWRSAANVTVYSGLTTDINWVLYSVTDVVYGTSQDAYVNKSEPDTNYGSDTSLSVAGNCTRIFAQFDLSSIPDTAIIISANLSLYYYDNESTAKPGPVGVYRVAGSWDEATITWNNSPSVQSTSIPTISVSPVAIGRFLTWNVSSVVQDWIEGSADNNGFMLRDNNESTSEGYKLFYSSEAGGQNPKLEISYYDPAAP